MLFTLRVCLLFVPTYSADTVTMPDATRKENYKKLFNIVTKYTSAYWGSVFIGELKRVGSEFDPKRLPRLEPEIAAEKFHIAKRKRVNPPSLLVYNMGRLFFWTMTEHLLLHTNFLNLPRPAALFSPSSLAYAACRMCLCTSCLGEAGIFSTSGSRVWLFPFNDVFDRC